jgi:hypothetical protein
LSRDAEGKEIDFSDLQLLARSDSPDLADAVIAFLEQGDPAPKGDPPPNTLTVDGLKAALRDPGLRWKAPAERRKHAQDTWARFLQQPDLTPPPRFRLPELLLSIYQRGSAQGRAALIDIIRRAPLRFGLWAGLKRIYKLAEVRLDAEVFGALAYRFDTERASYRTDVSGGTLVYLRRRAWRFLRQLGGSTPELYPQFVVQVLRHYDDERKFRGSWVANHVFVHHVKRGWTPKGFSPSLPQDLCKHRAFDEAWKRSPDALMLLLEMAQSDPPARFAIQGLRRDFPERLRALTPAWLGRLARRPLGSAHEFLIEVLQGAPEFHQGKLRALGLHETVLSLLCSPSAKARTYAVEYARAHATDLPGERLCDLLASELKETVAFAAATLKARAPRELGYPLLGRLLVHGETAPFAKKALSESFDRKEIPHDFLIDMLYGEDEQREWVDSYIKAKYPPKSEQQIPVDFWKRVLADPRRDQGEGYEAVDLALSHMQKYRLADLGAGWLIDSVTRDDSVGEAVAEWLERAEALPGLDVERVKGLVFSARYRRLALRLLGNTKLVRPRDLTLPWLLALARRSDPQLHEFAHRSLLEHWKPADFADAPAGPDKEKDKDKEAQRAGIARLFALATGDKEPEPVRLFAQTYLRCHHPVIGADQPEAKALQLKPQLPRAAYTAERLWPALFDARPDVRRFAVAITRAELRAWGYHTRVYELGESEAKEVRGVLFDAALKAGEEGADPACTLTVEELDAARVFALTESIRRPTREVGMELIRRHYKTLGGATRLAWLMESPDREVRLFAVRLLWEKHRPMSLPPGWRPKVAVPGVTIPGLDGAGADGEARFSDGAALRDFLRRVLFGVPPGRSMEPSEGTADIKRRLPASVAKRHVIEVVRDLALEDEGFAALALPVLSEFTGSLARGEWQACLAAAVAVQKAHPGLHAAQGMARGE